MTVVTNRQKRATGDYLNFNDILNLDNPLDGQIPLTVFTNKAKH